MAGLFSSVTNAMLDASVFYSFDRSGFLRHQQTFQQQDLDVDLTGKVILVTGANSGLGKETALALAKLNATVYLLCRNEERGIKAQSDIRSTTRNDQVFYQHIDVSDLESVHRFCQSFTEPKIDVLIHNAGVLPRTFQQSKQKMELTYATNIVGPHVLTHKLWPRLRQGRMILVSSGGMYPVKLNLEELQHPPQPFDGVRAYAQTKRAQVILAEIWAKKGTQQHTVVHAMHPGWADTPGVEQSLPSFWKHMKTRLRTPAEGADTIVWLAASHIAGKSSGQFWFDRKARKTYLIPGTKESPSVRKNLWDTLQQFLDS